MKWIFKPGLLLPFMGKRRLPVNRDGTPFDSGELDLLDEKAPFYIQIWAVEWLGFGLSFTQGSKVRDAQTGLPVN